MIEYIKTEKGYFYKKLKNGEKKRISEAEYIKTIKKGGLPARKLDIEFGIVTYQTIADCIKELIEAAYKLYKMLLDKKEHTTIVCGGQSPSYYCLSMMNFKIYNPDLVDIIILPHSKGGKKSNNQDIELENIKYCSRLKKKEIILKKNVVIIDGVHSGVGILALESALKYCYPYINITKIAINSQEGISEIPVNMEIILPCEPKFSDIFPRLVTSYYPINFNNNNKFITNFKLDDNPIAEMIIDISKNYPDISVEDTEWYKLNNEVNNLILKKRLEYNLKKKENENREKLKREILEKEKNNKEKGGFFKPIILYNKEGEKIYQCPNCKSISGTNAPKYPNNLSLFFHNYDCLNKFKIPLENLNN